MNRLDVAIAAHTECSVDSENELFPLMQILMEFNHITTKDGSK